MPFKPYYTIIKSEGETPLQALSRLRIEHAIPEDVPLAYAGRLDPMASGKLLVLVGDECKKQKEYHSLDKEYEFEILFGFTSDTGDILGIATQRSEAPLNSKSINVALATFSHTLSLPYPVFSSKTVKGKPLFLWKLENRLHEIEIPVAHTKIHKLLFTGLKTISTIELLATIEQRIALLPHVTEESKKLGADFRREEILAQWRTLLASNSTQTYFIASFTTIVSSGTYIRSLAPFFAEQIGAHGLAYSIHRTKLGTYLPLTKHTGFWWKKYN